MRIEAVQSYAATSSLNKATTCQKFNKINQNNASDSFCREDVSFKGVGRGIATIVGGLAVGVAAVAAAPVIGVGAALAGMCAGATTVVVGTGDAVLDHDDHSDNDYSDDDSN